MIGLVLLVLISYEFSTVPYGAKCALVCKKHYIPVAPQSRQLHQCGVYGWEDPDKYEMICEYSGKWMKESNMKYIKFFPI